MKRRCERQKQEARVHGGVDEKGLEQARTHRDREGKPEEAVLQVCKKPDDFGGTAASYGSCASGASSSSCTTCDATHMS